MSDTNGTATGIRGAGACARESAIRDPQSEISLEQMSIVVIGHVDHGKSTVVGRLLADTGSLPEGKLDQVKAQCARNARPFEYAFLLDALKDEQSQGITIDSARCFFKSSKRRYILIDAPGHVEFLKNMVSGAARAEAALLVIDAKEGVRENSRRHGVLLGMLGVRQVAVLVNKMDLVEYSQAAFEAIRDEYSRFLDRIAVKADHFIPASARGGEQIVTRSAAMPWFRGPSVLEALDGFCKEPQALDRPLRMPVQDVYKFTEMGDDRRIVAGRVTSGQVAVGDQVVFLPSGKRSRIASIEAFNLPAQTRAVAGQSTGVTLTEQVYVRPGEVMCKEDEPSAQVSTGLKVSLFWMGRQPMILDKRYKLKLGTASVPVWLRRIETVLDASDLTTDSHCRQIERHDVAECVLETLKPVAFDLSSQMAQTGRFVIVDHYEIAGGGVIREAIRSDTDRTTEHVLQRQQRWQRSKITAEARASRLQQRSALVLICGPAGTGKAAVAKALEERLFANGRLVYFLGLSNSLLGINADIDVSDERDEYLRRLGEISHLFTDAGLILITTISGLEVEELEMIRSLNRPGDCLVVQVGQGIFDQDKVDLQMDDAADVGSAVSQIERLLAGGRYLPEYYL